MIEIVYRRSQAALPADRRRHSSQGRYRRAGAKGSRLPSVRALGLQLTINPNTVAKAYAKLTTEGLIEPLKGVGLFVATPRQRLSQAERERRLEDAVQQLISAVLPLGFNGEEIVERVAPRARAAHYPRPRRNVSGDVG